MTIGVIDTFHITGIYMLIIEKIKSTHFCNKSRAVRQKKTEQKNNGLS